VPYIFISTAGIFGNDKEYYDEYDKPTPLSMYGKSKFYVEDFILNQSYEKFYIFRAGWMMGGGKSLDKKFVNKIFKQIKNRVNKLHVVDDKLGVPTYTNDFAYSIIEHIKNDLAYGLYNQVGRGEASRYDVAVELIDYLGLNVDVVKVNSNYFKDIYYAPRPYSEKLINKKLNDLNCNYMRDWKICLHEYLDEHFAQ
jgi:dTDP-4-dehydrorhamnose reductase